MAKISKKLVTKQSKVQLYLAQTIKKVVDKEIKPAQFKKAFLDLALDSMALVSLANQLEIEMNITLYPTVFFEYNTVEKLADFILSEFPETFKDFTIKKSAPAPAAEEENEPETEEEPAVEEVSFDEEEIEEETEEEEYIEEEASSRAGAESKGPGIMAAFSFDDADDEENEAAEESYLADEDEENEKDEIDEEYEEEKTGSGSGEPIRVIESQEKGVIGTLVQDGELNESNSMQVVFLTKPGSFKNLVLGRKKIPEPGPDEVRIRVLASGVNFSDVMSVLGVYPNASKIFPYVMGNEVAGYVEAVGKNVTAYKKGSKVIGLTDGFDGYSEYVVLEQSQVMKKPRNMSYSQGASFPIIFLTAYHALHYLARIDKNETILIMGAAGGVGLVAVQMALRMGLQVIGAAGSDEKLKYLKSLGVHHTINYRKKDVVKEVRSITENRGVEVVLTSSQGDMIPKLLTVLGVNGRFLEMGMAGIRSAPPLDLRGFVDNQSFFSIDLKRIRSKIIQSHLDIMYKWVTNGTIKPISTADYDYLHIKEAFQLIATRKNIGKVIVTFPDSPKNREVKRSVSNEVAIIGMACDYPGGENLDEFWESLRSGKDGVKVYPRERTNLAGIEPVENAFLPGGFIKDIDGFDPLFFNISKAEASVMDPQQRLFLMKAYEAIERAGYAGEGMLPANTSVYVGVSRSDYQPLVEQLCDKSVAAHAVIGNTHSMVPGRISYFLNVSGPAIAVNTACSSSLVALHQACAGIINGSSDMAIAGGVNLLITPQSVEAFSSMNALSPDGKCKTFDAGANGFVSAEGVGVVLLKSYEKAREDGDTIWAVVKGTALNNDGHSNGITAPNPKAQTSVIKDAMEQAGIDGNDINFIEAHGTGTNLGDPVEIQGLKQAFKDNTTPESCGLGSVKTNIGHSETAAGIAGVIKAVLAMKHKELPPLLHFKKLNTSINLKDSPFYIVDSLRPWETGGMPRIAGISSFGFNGTNAHVIVEEADSQAESNYAFQSDLFTLSAQSEKALDLFIRKMADFLEDNPDSNLRDICYTANRGKRHLNYRIAGEVESIEELKENLLSILDGKKTGTFFRSNKSKEQKLIFHLTGPAKKDDKVSDYLKEHPGIAAIIEKTGLKSSSPQGEAFLYEYAFARMLIRWGLVPEALIGTGKGIFTALAAAGILTAKEALECAEAGELSPSLHYTEGDIPLISSTSFEQLDTHTGFAVELKKKKKGAVTGDEDTRVIALNPNSINQNQLEKGDAEEDNKTLLHFMAELYANGTDFDWTGFYQHENPGKTVLPTYPFIKTSCWLQPEAGEAQKGPQKQKKPALKKTAAPEETGKNELLSEIQKQSSNAPAKTGSAPEEYENTELDRVKGIFAKILKIDEDDIDENINFEAYGVDSMFIAQAVKEAEEIYHDSIEASIFYEYPNAQLLSEYFSEKYGSSPSAGSSRDGANENDGDRENRENNENKESKDKLLGLLDSLVDGSMSLDDAGESISNLIDRKNGGEEK